MIKKRTRITVTPSLPSPWAALPRRPPFLPSLGALGLFLFTWASLHLLDVVRMVGKNASSYYSILLDSLAESNKKIFEVKGESLDYACHMGADKDQSNLTFILTPIIYNYYEFWRNMVIKILDIPPDF